VSLSGFETSCLPPLLSATAVYTRFPLVVRYRAWLSPTLEPICAIAYPSRQDGYTKIYVCEA